MGHKGKHRFEDKVPQQQRFRRQGEEISTTAKPISSQTGEAPAEIPQRKRRYGEFLHDSEE